MPTDTRIEAAARANCWSVCGWADPTTDDCQGCGGSEHCKHWRAFETRTRAAVLAFLKAAREPSAEMMGESGALVLNKYVGADPADSHYGTAQWAHECWQAMLDQLIAEIE